MKNKLFGGALIWTIALIGPSLSDTVSSTSVLRPEFKPDFLISGPRVIWHAASPLTYPQKITVSLSPARIIKEFGFMPQTKNIDRGPKSFILYGTLANGISVPLVRESNACLPPQSDAVARYWNIRNSKIFVKLEMEITQNCGNKDFISIERLYLKPDK